MSKIYTHASIVTLGETSSLQHMYFHEFFKLAGVTRELWVKDCVSGGVEDFGTRLALITRDATCAFKKDFFLYDPVRVELQFTAIQRTNTTLRFRFRHGETNELHAEGCQTIVFADAKKKITRIPENWKAAIYDYGDFTETLRPPAEQEVSRPGEANTG